MSIAEKTEAFFRKKYGPLEVWQWGGIAIGAVVVYMIVTRQGSGAGETITPADAALPSGGGSGDVASDLNIPQEQAGGGVVTPFPTADPISVVFIGPSGQDLTGQAAPDSVAFAPKTTTTSPTTTTVATPGGIATKYISPVLNSVKNVLGGGPTYLAPTTSNAFEAPFQAPSVSEITPVEQYSAEHGLPLIAQPGSQIQEVGGVPISLSAAAIARGGVPARDIPLNPTPATAIVVPTTQVP